MKELHAYRLSYRVLSRIRIIAMLHNRRIEIKLNAGSIPIKGAVPLYDSAYIQILFQLIWKVLSRCMGLPRSATEKKSFTERTAKLFFKI